MNDIVAADFLKRLTDALDPVPDSVPAIRDSQIDDLIPVELVPAAVLVPLVKAEDGWEVLLTRRTSHLKHHAGQIAFPGGRMEATDRTPEETALRETYEEVGIHPDSVEVIGSLDPLPTITGYRVVPVVGLVTPGFQLTIDHNEVDQVFQAPLEFVLDPSNRQQQSAMFRGRSRSFFVIQFQQHTIWGATASMLVNMANRLDGS